jgi:hypothetical protein
MKQLIETTEALRVRGIGFCSLTEALDTTTAQGRLVFHMFGALAEFEHASSPGTADADRPVDPQTAGAADTLAGRTGPSRGARNPEPQTMRKIPQSQFGHIRTLVKYGITVAQVAEVYGAAVGDIERILRQS